MTTRNDTLSWRLFVALAADEAVTAELREVLARARDELGELEGADGIRWLPAERWHLTVLFIGDVETSRVGAVTDACASACEHTAAFTWRLSGCSATPSIAKPRVLWSPAVASDQALERLHRATRRAVVSAGQQVERRSYHPHLTVARVRTRTPEVRGAVRHAVDSLREFRSSPTDATTVRLLRSHLGPAPRYEELARWSLTG